MEKHRPRDIDIKYNLKVYLSFFKEYKLYAAIILLFAFLNEAFYAFFRFIFKIVIDNGTEFANGELSLDRLAAVLIFLAIVYLGTLLLQAVLMFYKMHMLNRLEYNLIIDVKRKFFNHIVHLSYGFFTSHKTGSLISRIVRGGSAMERMTDTIIFNVAPLVFQLVVVVGSLLYFDATSAVVVILTSIAFVAYSLYIQIKQKPLNAAQNMEEDIEKAYVGDVMANIDSIKYFGKENLIKQRFKNMANSSGNAALKLWDMGRWFEMGHPIILGIGLFFLVYFPLLKFINNGLTLGSLVFIYTLYGSIIGSLFGFVRAIREYYRSMADFQDLFQYGRLENDIKDKPGALKARIKQGIIEFKNVSFKYGKKIVFEDFSLKIGKHKKIALVGHSGSGKSTLIKLLYRFYDVGSGGILIDGINIKNFKQESLRSELSIVPQECILFDDTVYNNVAFSKPGAIREEVVKAMQFAQLDKVVEGLPNKEQTIVGERGVKLSGGEKQRVSIARAILANKKILVLDEATSSLDSQTEHDIQKDLLQLMRNRTSIIIAHRLSTIMHADAVVVLEKGRIVQQGAHKDLIKKQGLYRRLWELQKGGYIR